MTHRSVPRAVALGLGIGVIIPFFHTVIAAMLAIPLRANVAIAAAFTLVVNPLTIPPMYYAAYRIGSWELHHDATLVNPATAARVSGELGRFLFWIHEASGPIALGDPDDRRRSRRRSAISLRRWSGARGSKASGAHGAKAAKQRVHDRGFDVCSVRNARSSIGDGEPRRGARERSVQIMSFGGYRKWLE